MERHQYPSGDQILHRAVFLINGMCTTSVVLEVVSGGLHGTPGTEIKNVAQQTEVEDSAW